MVLTLQFERRVHRAGLWFNDGLKGIHTLLCTGAKHLLLRVVRHEWYLARLVTFGMAQSFSTAKVFLLGNQKIERRQST